jgi:hypothetical protein
VLVTFISIVALKAIDLTSTAHEPMMNMPKIMFVAANKQVKKTLRKLM